MEHKAKLIKPHFEDLVAGVHEDLKQKGIDGVRVSAIHFASADQPPCGPGMKWDCRANPQTGGVDCRCYPQ